MRLPKKQRKRGSLEKKRWGGGIEGPFREVPGCKVVPVCNREEQDIRKDLKGILARKIDEREINMKI